VGGRQRGDLPGKDHSHPGVVAERCDRRALAASLHPRLLATCFTYDALNRLQGGLRPTGGGEPYAFEEVLLRFAERKDEASRGAYAVLGLRTPRQKAGEAGQQVIHCNRPEG
jgi:hypothetical protein